MGIPRVTSSQSTHSQPDSDQPVSQQQQTQNQFSLKEFLAVSLLPIGPLGILSRLFGEKEDVPPPDVVEARGLSASPPAEPPRPKLPVVIKQYSAAYAEQFQKLGVNKDKDVRVLASYFAAWGINHWSTLPESQRALQTQEDRLSQDIIDRAQTIFNDIGRTTFSRQRIQQLLKIARVFEWVKNNEEGTAANGFDAIDKRSTEIVSVWNRVEHKIRKEKFGYSGGPIPDLFLIFMKNAAAKGEDPLRALEPPAASSTRTTRQFQALPRPEHAAPPAARSPQGAEPVKHIMNLQAFEVPTYFWHKDSVMDQLKEIDELRDEPDDRLRALAQAITFRWRLHLMKSRPNISLGHMDTSTQRPTPEFIENEAMRLASANMTKLEAKPKNIKRRALAALSNNRSYSYDEQTLDYLSELALYAFECSFFDKVMGRFYVPSVFVDFFVNDFAPLKGAELEYVWSRMPKELRKALGKPNGGKRYPDLFIELMLSAKNGLSIDYILQRSERPVRVSYGIGDDRGTIPRQVHDELARSNPGLLFYANVFDQLVHYRSWKIKEAEERAANTGQAERAGGGQRSGSGPMFYAMPAMQPGALGMNAMQMGTQTALLGMPATTAMPVMNMPQFNMFI